MRADSGLLLHDKIFRAPNFTRSVNSTAKTDFSSEKLKYKDSPFKKWSGGKPKKKEIKYSPNHSINFVLQREARLGYFIHL
ncbi:hypothetical protein NUKP16_09380 [Klebsiella quasipneumoniae]|nr:hypothetical protein NUKP16_09380 [Klebsiella quasipneumoniae]GKQ03793.1 hypothetical protein NUKP771_23720 [Klebsiella quasipneumoniae]